MNKFFQMFACVVVMLATSHSLAQCVGAWSVTATTGPTAWEDPAMAYDAGRARTVLFGGFDTARRNDTWEYNGATSAWSHAAPATSPSARERHGMAYDAAHSVTVMFGGRDNTGAKNDTWTWNGSSWTLVSSSGPSARYGHKIAYDAARQRVVLFGGRNAGSALLGDTWEWNGATWTQMASTGPSARETFAMCYDTARAKVILHGGFSGSAHQDDTWEWNGIAWSLVAATGPGARSYHCMSSDPACNRVILYGGSGSGPTGTITWGLTGSTWTQIATTAPSLRESYAMVSDTGRNRVVAFGGFAGATTSPLTNTIEWPTGTSTPPSGAGTSVSVNNCAGSSVCLTVHVTPGSNPPSTGLQVLINLSSLGASPTQPMMDDGTGCDVAAGDNTFSVLFPIATSTAPGNYSLPFTVIDSQGRSGSGTLELTVTACPSSGLTLPVCEDFESFATGIQPPGWIASTSFASVQTSGVSGHYLQVTDDTPPFPSPRSIVYTNARFTGDWSHFACQCGASQSSPTLEFDVRLFNDGDTQTSHPFPRIQISNGDPLSSGHIEATFVSSVGSITSSTGWVHVIAPIPCNASNLVTPLGTWTVTGGTWSALLSNVTHIILPIELTSGAEVWGWDNICLRPCDPERCLSIKSLATTSNDTTNLDSSQQWGLARGRSASSLSILANRPDGFTTRYASIVAADTRGTAIGGRQVIQAVPTEYDVAFNVNAQPGEDWCVQVYQKRVGQFTLYDDSSPSSAGYADACLTGVSGTLIPAGSGPGAASLVGGTMNLPAVKDCNIAGQNFGSSSGGYMSFDETPTGFNQKAFGLITGTGPQVVTLRFHWYGTAHSNGSLGDGDSVGIRMGLGITDDIISSQVCTYPGDPVRTQEGDGHFVEVRCIDCVKEQCHSFDVSAEPLPLPTSPAAVENFTTTGPTAQPLYNPFNGGAPPSPAPGQVAGHLRVVEAFEPGSATKLVAPESFTGKWNCLCGYLEFDIRVFDDGVTGTVPLRPTVEIVRDEGATGTNTGFTSPSNVTKVSGTFTSSTIVTENPTPAGWTHVRIPIPPGVPTGTLGTWSLPGLADTEWLLGHVTSVMLSVQTSTGRAIIDYDNICIRADTDCVAPPSRLVGWWPFDEGTTPLHDIAGSAPTRPAPDNNHLGGAPTFAYNAPSPCHGMVEGALRFDGVGQEVVVPGPTAPLLSLPLTDFSIDAWVKTSVADHDQPIVDKRDFNPTDPPIGYRLFLRSGKLALGMADANLGAGESVFESVGGSATLVADGKWHFVAGTVKRFGAGAVLKLYVDGVVVGLFSPASKSGSLGNPNANLYIGSSHPIGEPATYFNGCIDEVEIFRKTLSAAEIQSIFNAGCAGKCREFCDTSVDPCGWQPPFFRFRPKVYTTICNGTSVSKTYNVSFNNNTSGSGCSSVLLGLPTPFVVTVPAGQCRTFIKPIAIPGTLGNGTACYTVTVTPVGGGRGFSCAGATGGCYQIATSWNGLIVGAPMTPVMPLPVSGPASGFTAAFTIGNSGTGAGGVSYRISAVNMDGSPASVSLNGLPPGQPLLGQVPLNASETRNVLTTITNLDNVDPGPAGSFRLELEVLGASGYQPAAYMELIPSGEAQPALLSRTFEGETPNQCLDGEESFFENSDCAVVSLDQAFSPDQSVLLIGSDPANAHGASIVERTTINSGRWQLDAMTFVPATAIRNLYSIVLDRLDTPSDPVHYGGWVVLDANNNTVRNVINSAQRLPLVRDQWVPLRFEVDLDADTVRAWYNDQPLFTAQSYRNAIVFPGSTPHGDGRVSAFVWFAGDPLVDGSSGAYVDDLRVSYLGPPPAALCLADLVSIGGLPPPDGLVSGDDFIAFIVAFAAGDLLADIVSIGGAPPPDGLVTGDDFNAFVAAFAAGCP